MKVSEILTEGGVVRKKLDQTLLQPELDKMMSMTPREQREAYKPFGKLGKLTTPEQVIQHRVDGSNKHDWGFDYQVAEFTQFMCSVCGKTAKKPMGRRR